MKKIFCIFIVTMILGIVFTGCATQEVAVDNDAFIQGIIVEDIITENIIVEEIITENIIVEKIID